MSVRLNKEIRQEIVRAALSFKFKKEDREAKRVEISERSEVLARKVYEFTLRKEGVTHDQLLAAPNQKFMRTSNTFEAYISLPNGYRYQFSTYFYKLLETREAFNSPGAEWVHVGYSADGERTPIFKRGERFYSVSDRLQYDDRLLITDPVLAAEIQQFMEDKDAYDKAYEQAKAKLIGFLDSFTTLRQLEKAWPEGEPFYRKYLADPVKKLVPTVLVEDINKTFGVPLAVDQDIQ